MAEARCNGCGHEEHDGVICMSLADPQCPCRGTTVIGDLRRRLSEKEATIARYARLLDAVLVEESCGGRDPEDYGCGSVDVIALAVGLDDLQLPLCAKHADIHPDVIYRRPAALTTSRQPDPAVD